MPAKRNLFTPCGICLSPYRYQLEQAYIERIPKKDLIEKYVKTMVGGKTGFRSPEAFTQALWRHMKNPHYKKSKKFPYLEAPPGSPQKTTAATLQSLSQGLLQIGADMVKYWQDHPDEARKELKMNDVIRAQDAITNRMRVEVEQDALKLTMAKLMGGFIPATVEEGEVVGGELVTTQVPKLTNGEDRYIHVEPTGSIQPED